jgi:hypothetical protein
VAKPGVHRFQSEEKCAAVEFVLNSEANPPEVFHFMQAKLFRLACHSIVTLMAMALFVPKVQAQTGHVALTATVSETVALSALPNLTQGNVHTDVMSSGNAVRITLSGVNSEAAVIRVPLLVRSNSGFKITVAAETKTATVTQLSVVDAQATGTLVSPQAISALAVPPRFDLRGINSSASSALNPLDDVRPLLVASGPRVSLAGTLNSPNNAMQVTILIGLQPQTAHEWSIHLTFVGTPG